MPHSFRSFLAQLSEQARPQVAQTIRRHAMRQVATLKASGAALAHAPTLDDRASAVERAREELAHLEEASELYRELSGKDLLKDAEGAAATLPIPSSWMEASVAQLVLCLAARVDLERQTQVEPALQKLTDRSRAHETEHVAAARSALSELCSASAAQAREATEYIERWLPVALDSLDAHETKQAYLAELERESRAIGLSPETT
jgi:1,2-phenylacetyl-CoA epoxidase catalytic subunit